MQREVIEGFTNTLRPAGMQKRLCKCTEWTFHTNKFTFKGNLK